MEGDRSVCKDICWDFDMSGDSGPEANDGVERRAGVDAVDDVDAKLGVCGTAGVDGRDGSDDSWRSFDRRFEVTLVGDTERPAFCRARIRSAMVPPGLRTGPSTVLSASASLN